MSAHYGFSGSTPTTSVGVPPGDPGPSEPTELSFLSIDTRTTYVGDYAGADGGKTGNFMLTWVATTGVKGPVEQKG